jgi:enamine deaminase RidA (YjgF/YER057c/UK114 family)
MFYIKIGMEITTYWPLYRRLRVLLMCRLVPPAQAATILGTQTRRAWTVLPPDTYRNGVPMSVETRMQELGIELPQPIAPAANYVRYHMIGNMLYISGTGPAADHPKGKVGADLTVEDGYAAARSVGLQLLATAQAALGSLDRVTRVVKVLGMVNADPLFENHPQVINGCSDLLVEVLGDAGRHTRSAVGFGSLPKQISVEIEATFEFE